MAKEKNPDVTLSDAQTELIAINAKLSDSGRRRDQLLLAGNETELDQIEAEVANLQRAHERQVARIKLLEQKAALEQAEAAAKERTDAIARIEKMLAASRKGSGPLL